MTNLYFKKFKKLQCSELYTEKYHTKYYTFVKICKIFCNTVTFIHHFLKCKTIYYKYLQMCQYLFDIFYYEILYDCYFFNFSKHELSFRRHI